MPSITVSFDANSAYAHAAMFEREARVCTVKAVQSRDAMDWSVAAWGWTEAARMFVALQSCDSDGAWHARSTECTEQAARCRAQGEHERGKVIDGELVAAADTVTF